jgi:hypothetical protein
MDTSKAERDEAVHKVSRAKSGGRRRATCYVLAQEEGSKALFIAEDVPEISNRRIPNPTSWHLGQRVR